MQLTIDETTRRREKQITYNTQHGITPKQINKKIDETLSKKAVVPVQYGRSKSTEQDLQYNTEQEKTDGGSS